MKNLFLIVFLLSAITLPSFAGEGDWLVRMRAINVMPEEEGTPTTIGGDIKLNNESVPELDISYFFTDNFAVELILATATHEAMAYNTSLNNLDLGNVSLLPPTLIAQYHHQFKKFKPYVGAGINYTFFYNDDPGVAKTTSYENSFGWGFQLGADYELKKDLYLNFDIKKIYLSTDVRVETYSNGAVTATLDIDPYIVGLGVGFRF